MAGKAMGILLLLVYTQSVGAADLKPADVGRFFVTPNQPAMLAWTIEPGTPRPEAVLYDYEGKSLGSVPLKPAGQDGLEATVTLAPGFYEIEIPGTSQRFGILSIDPHAGAKDPFFAIDAAMSWLVHGDPLREQLVEALARSGVNTARERLSWGQINPAKDTWEWDSPRHYETLRKVYAANGVEMLEMFHNAPHWTGMVGKYPDDLVATSQAWSQISRRWHTNWAALEVWNEPDISFGDYLPGDQYMPLVHTLAYTWSKNGIDTPLVGGVFAHFERHYLDNVALNGMLDSVDAVSFHTYGRAAGMEGLIGKYRDWLAAHDREAMPLWITECGRPWRRGPDRPPADQDAESALDVTMKAVESRACGIARYFPFVYPFYEERDNNFGLLGREATPLRSMAGYARLASLLAHTRYLGDLRVDDPAIRTARVFGNDKRTVAVLYTGAANSGATASLPVAVERLEGIDGRQLQIGPDGKVPVPDGLVYAWLDRRRLDGSLETDTAAMRLTAIGQEPPPKRHRDPSPIVLRYQFDPEVVDARTDGYHLKQEGPASMKIAVRAFNLSHEPQSLTLRLAFPEAVAEVIDAADRELNVAAGGFADTTWTIDLAGAFAATGRARAVVSADGRTPALTIDLAGSATLEEVLKRFPRKARLPLDNLAAWKSAITGGGQMEIRNLPEGIWQLKAEFKGGDRWVYPRFTLPDGVDVSQYTGLAFRARAEGQGTVRAILWEGNTGAGYLTSTKILSDDNQWHTAVVLFEDLTPSSANAPDANHRLDLDTVRHISLGMNSEVDHATLEIRDAWLIGPE